MRPLGLGLVLALSAASAHASVQLSHSGFVLDGDDAPVDASGLAARFSLYDGASGGTLVWEGTCAVDVRAGHYAVQLGAPDCGPALGPSEFPLGEERWLEVRLGGVTLLPRHRLAAGATAANAHALEGKTLADLTAMFGNQSQWTTNGSAIHYSLGPVGIGTSSPGNVGLLTIDGGATADHGVTFHAAGTPLGYVAMPGQSGRYVGTSTGNADLVFRTVQPDASFLFASGSTAGAGTELVRIQANGDVGLGRTPAYKLDVNGTINATQVLVNGAPVSGSANRPPILAWVPAALDLGVVPGTSVDRALALVNLGDTAAASLSVTATAGFSVVAVGCGTELAAGGSCHVVVRANASVTAGVVNGTLSATATSANTAAAPLTATHAPVGLSQTNPAASCKDAKQKLGTTTDALYWIDPDGPSGLPAFEAWCDMNTDGGGWTLVSRIKNDSRKHLHSSSYGGTPVPNGTLPAKFSDAVINALRTNTAPGGTFSNSFRFACDNVPVQYFPLSCSFVASASVASGACHDYATTATSVSYVGGYGDSNDCGLGGHHNDPQKSSYGWHNCGVSDSTVATYPVSETPSSSTGCGHNQLNVPGRSGTLWVR